MAQAPPLTTAPTQHKNNGPRTRLWKHETGGWPSTVVIIVHGRGATSLSVTPWLYLCYMCFISNIIFLLYVPPACLSTSYWTLLDLATISIFSSYVPLCDMSLIFLFMYRYSHAYVSLHHDSLMTPLHCYVHAPLSFAAIDSNSFVTCSLPYCTSTYAFPATDVYFYDIYDVFFP